MALTDDVLHDTMFGCRAARACGDPLLFILRHLRKHMSAKWRGFGVALTITSIGSCCFGS